MKKQINLVKLAKWFALLSSLAMSIILVMMFYKAADGRWLIGSQEWEHSSVFEIHNGVLVPKPGTTGPGPMQFQLKQILITVFGGGALAFAGVLLQKTTRNNLAEVSILGIGSINIMMIFAYALIFKSQIFGDSLVAQMLPLVTIASSLLGTFIVYFISRSKKANKNTFVIIGIALQLLFEAVSVIFINPSKLSDSKDGKEMWGTIKHYTMGIVDSEKTSWTIIIVAAVAISVLVGIALMLRKKIDIYDASPALATTLGIKTERLRFTIFAIVALIAGVEASILGTVALLGLIAPSIARLMFKNKFMPLAIASFVIGAILVTLAHWMSVNLFGSDFPAGILATAIASPYFIFLILRGK